MSLTSVTMSEEVWLTCMTHALSTETEEIMGLLLGDIEHSKDGKITAKIWSALPQPRSDRQKDRVETNPEQLTAASILAEKMTVATGTTTRVIGWYHSHPHITVLPSHVDVRTQAMYQLMDSGFIGLIFSCFSEDAQKVGRIQVLAFQSLDGKHSHTRPLALSLTTSRKNPAINFESSLSSSDNAGALVVYSGGENMEQDTGDVHANAIASKVGVKSPRLEGFFASADAKSGNSSQFNSLQNAISDIDPMDMSEGMQEAMHLSSLETSGAEFVRKEVPLYVVPASSLLCLESPLFSFTNLQCMLFEEEKKAYNEATVQNTRNGKIHPLSFVHHTSTYRASICKIIEYCLSPAMTVLQDRLRENEIKLKLLKEEANMLESEISKGTSSNSSPNVSESKISKGSSLNSSPLSPYQWGHRSVTSSEHGDLYPVDSMSSPKK